MKHPIALIGAGPIGLEIAVNLKAAGLPYLHFEAAAPAQTIAHYPKDTRFFSSGKTLAICGLPFFENEKPSKEQYVEYLRKVAQHFQLEIRTREKLDAIETTGDGFVLKSPLPPHTFKVSTIIFAIGNMHTPRQLGIPGEIGPRVHHRVEHPEQFTGQSVIVIGGRNSAVETALRCHRAGAKVSICYRGASFDNGSVKPWLLDELNQAIGNHKLDSYTRVIPTHITPAGIHMKSQLTGLGKLLPYDQILVQVGYTMDSKLIDDLGAVKLSKGSEWAYQINTETMETSVPNVFIAGSAAAGQQSAVRLFVENSHSHVLRILRRLTGVNPRFINPLAYEQLESSAQRVLDIQASFQSPTRIQNSIPDPTIVKAPSLPSTIIQPSPLADTELETEYKFNPGIEEEDE